MKRLKIFIGTILIFVFLPLAGKLIANVYYKIKEKNHTQINMQNLPAFSFFTLDNKLFSAKDLNSYTGKIIINFFNPECEHCQYMSKKYIEYADSLKNIKIIMVTNADSATTVKFVTDFKLNSLSNIIVLRDTKFAFFKLFGSSVVPSFFVYKNQTLLKKISGETKIENLFN